MFLQYMCHVPNKAHPHPDPDSLYMTGDIHIPVPDMYGHTPEGHPDSRVDTFLSTLGEAEPLGRGSGGRQTQDTTRLKGQLQARVRRWENAFLTVLAEHLEV